MSAAIQRTIQSKKYFGSATVCDSISGSPFLGTPEVVQLGGQAQANEKEGVIEWGGRPGVSAATRARVWKPTKALECLVQRFANLGGERFDGERLLQQDGAWLQLPSRRDRTIWKSRNENHLGGRPGCDDLFSHLSSAHLLHCD